MVPLPMSSEYGKVGIDYEILDESKRAAIRNAEAPRDSSITRPPWCSASSGEVASALRMAARLLSSSTS